MGNITDQDVAAIEALRQPWIQACLDRDWDSLLGLCTDDIELYPPDAPQASGPVASRTFLESFPVMKVFTFAFTKIDGRNDMAVGRGSFSITAEVEGNEVVMNGKFADVFNKVGDAWRFQLVVWNTDNPMG